jgi:hypothetical protein
MNIKLESLEYAGITYSKLPFISLSSANNDGWYLSD